MKTRPLVYFASPFEQAIELEEKSGGPEALFEVLKPIDLRLTHGIEVKLEHLQAMVESYDPALLEAALNFDHAWEGPLHGVAREVFLRGQSLWARFSKLSQQAIDAIKSGQWPRRSAEFSLEHPVMGKPYFQGLALLGAVRPAVPGLAPAQLFFSMPVDVVDLSEANAGAGESAPITAPNEGQKEHDMGKELQPAPASSTPPATTPAAAATGVTEAQLAEQTQKLAETQRQLETRLAAAEQEQTKARRVVARAEVKAELDALGSRITPAVRRELEPLLVELSAAPQPVTVELAAADGKVAPVGIRERIFAALKALPENPVLGRAELSSALPGETAVANLSDAERRAGITPEKAAEIQAKYPDAFEPTN